MRAAAEGAGRVRRPQHLLARADARARLHLFLHWPLSRARVLVTGGAGYIGSHARQGAAAAPATASSSSTTSSPAIATPCSYGELVEGDITDVAAVRERAARATGSSAVMHFAAFLDVGESVRDPVALLPQQRRRRAERARGDGGRIGRATSSSRRPARPTASRSRRRSPKRTRSSRSTATARRSWRSSARCRTSSAPTACARSRCAISTPPGADPDGEIGEDHSPEIHLIPRAIEAATGGPRPAGVRRRLSDAGRHLPARLHPRVRSRRRPRQGARGARRDRRVRRLQSRHRPSAFGARGDRHGRARHRPHGALDAGAAAAGRSGGAVRGAAEGAGRAALDAALRRSRRDRPDRLGLAPHASARLRRPAAHS